MKVKKEILANEYVYSVITRFFQIVTSVIRSAVIARYLGTSLKGENAYISSLVIVISTVISLGVHEAYPFYRKKHGKERVLDDFLNSVSCLFLAYFVVCFFVFFVASIPLSIRAAILLSPLHGFANTIAFVLLVEEPNRRNKANLVINILELSIIVFITLFFERSTFVSIVILTISDLLQMIYCLRFFKPRIMPCKKVCLMILELTGFGFMPMIALLMTMLNYKIDLIMLNWFPSVISTSMVGIYSVGVTISDYIAIIPDTIKGVLTSKLAKGHDEREVAKACRMCFLAGLFISLFFVITGRHIICILYGLHYADSYLIMCICSFGSIFICFFKLIASYNLVNNKQRVSLGMISISVLINIILNLMMIPKLKLIGAALASCIGYTITGILFVARFSKESHIPIKDLFVVKKTDYISMVNWIFKGKEI